MVLRADHLQMEAHLKGFGFTLNTSTGSNNGINIGCSRFSGSDLVAKNSDRMEFILIVPATGAGNANHWVLQNIQSDDNHRDAYDLEWDRRQRGTMYRL
jgi:hypothetical protein